MAVNDKLTNLDEDEEILIIEDDTNAVVPIDSASPPGATHSSLTTWKILLVDDDLGVHQTTSLVLKTLSLKVKL